MIDKDLQILRDTWTFLGQSQVYWSVLTHNKYKPENLNDSYIKDFFRSGNESLNELEKILNRHGASFKDKVVLDFGCGVGRVASHCSKIAKKVYGFDISEPHLEVAKKFAPDAEFHQVQSYKSLPTVSPCPEIIYSLMVLQHNRPRLIERYVIMLLKLLQNKGHAILHIPYHIDHYQGNQPTNILEMHSIPKSRIEKIVSTLDCVMLEEIHRPEHGVKSYFYVIEKR